ncbi:hypothetical protein HA402_008826 [Bradysia odoriphaga]|nr:hypothetical protein HA402_008826 [Bradysia odoriphaga]
MLHSDDVHNIPDAGGRVLINTKHPVEDPDIFLQPKIAIKIKAHQIGGIRFMYDNIIGSLQKFDTVTGTGCILAHAMGLGKTLQVVTFCDLFLKYTSAKKVLCVVPINTIHNWMNEFNTWLPVVNGTREFELYALSDPRRERMQLIDQWADTGGVMLIGYEMFRHLAKESNVYEALINPGPDLVICDEGHRIKNSHADISVALNEIRTLRRIVMTGYPLQNNLAEYFCMVNFVKPNYLGTKSNFFDFFEIPIKNGQYNDSSKDSIKLMQFRSYVLHTILRPIVQRRSNKVVEDALPKLHDYVIPLKMTNIQKKLYTAFENEIMSKSVQNPLILFATGSKIWNHPDILFDFMEDRSSERNATIEQNEINYDWASNCFKNYIPNVIENSSKMQVFFFILSESVEQGDKVLIFSQSLTTLALIEKFLRLTDVAEIKWKENYNYFRLDGSTSSKQREKLISEFNSKPDVHLFLISTRAGSMGVNLVAANRVVIFDVSWNPCNDNQAIYRVHRFNQTKECYIYRLVMDSSLEMTVYLKQVNKQAISARVVDHRNPDLVSSSRDLSTSRYYLHQTEVEDLFENNRQYEDGVIEKTVKKLSTQIARAPFEHSENLLDNNQNALTSSEKECAMAEYDTALGVNWIAEEKWRKQGIWTEVVRLKNDRTAVDSNCVVLNTPRRRDAELDRTAVDANRVPYTPRRDAQ